MDKDGDKLSEQTVKDALNGLNWVSLKSHIDQIAFSQTHVSQLCDHIRRYTDLICKYPRKEYEERRTMFFEDARAYVKNRLGAAAADELITVTTLIYQIERGYRSILEFLGRCEIAKQPAAVRAGGCISLACHQYEELINKSDRALADAKELNPMSGIRLHDDSGTTVSVDGVLEGLAESVAMTLIMEAYKNDWFLDNTVVLPDLPIVGEETRYQSGSTQALALCWRQWQRVEKRRRFLGGEFVLKINSQLPPGLPEQISTLICYQPAENEQSECEVLDYLANARLRDRLSQNYMEMEFESVYAGLGVGITAGAALPPEQLVSVEEAHAGVALSELLGYAIASDSERPAGLRLVEWVRGYIVLKEFAKAHASGERPIADKFAALISESELISLLQRCGLKGDVAKVFVALACLHRSSRDMFDCPLIRVGATKYLVFGPAVIDVNVAMVVLSNLANRATELGRKGTAFENAVREFFHRRGMPAFGFRVHRNGEEYEYDAVVPWGDYLFVFECKNRSLSGNDPVQVHYFDQEVASQAKQVRRLVNALKAYPDIIAQELGERYKNCEIVPCVLHSLPYARVGTIDGVYFTDWSALTRFFEQPYVRIKIPYRVGNATLLHRVAIRKFWKNDAPTAAELLDQLGNPFQLELSMNHMDVSDMLFPISESELVLAPELVRNEITARSVCEAVGIDADRVLKEIASVGEAAKNLRSSLKRDPNESGSEGGQPDS